MRAAFLSVCRPCWAWHGLVLSGWLVLPVLFLAAVSHAQVATNITSSGLGTTVTPVGTTYNITGGSRPGGSTNLFHSFGRFDVGRTAGVNDIASFLNQGSVDLAGNLLPAGLSTSNILARVTDPFPSQIFGTIRTTDFGNANLFLMNPAGIIFGANATLNVGGMAAFTTADYLRLEEIGDGNAGIFHADPAQTSMLTSAPVAAFGFLGPTPATAITVQGSMLQVPITLDPETGQPRGNTLSLIGGNISVVADPDTGTPASLLAPSGRIDLVSVASPGEVLYPSLQARPNVNGESFTTMGNTTISGFSILDVSDNAFEAEGRGGTVRIRGGQFVLDSSIILANTFGNVDGATTAVSVEVQGDVSLSNTSVITAQAADVGNSGDIGITAKNVQVMDGSVISTSSAFSSGQAGNIMITASDSLSIAGTDAFGNPSSISSLASFVDGNSGTINISSSFVTLDRGIIQTQSFGDGLANDITVQTGNTNVVGGGVIEAFASGNGATGAVSIAALGTVSVSGEFGGAPSRISNSSTGAGGHGGLTINAAVVSLTGGGRIQSEASSQAGTQLTVSATDSILISGGSEIFSKADFVDVGPIQLSAPNITIDQAAIRSQTVGSGTGGAILVQGNLVQLSNGATISASSTGTGNAGSVTVQGASTPADTVVVDGAGSGLFTTTEGTGAGGNINILAQLVTVQNGGTLSAATSGTAPTATGGTILVNAKLQDGQIIPTAAQSVSLSNGATISASSTGPANAGDIVINAGNTFLMENSSVTTKAAQAGGGNITVKATDMVLLTNSQLSASVLGGSGGGGNITIDPQFVILQNSQILAQAILGAGGNISITTNLFLPDSLSIVDASSQFGVNGNVTIQSPISQAGGKIVPLSNMPLETTALLGQRCAALAAGGQFSSFVMTGRDILPTEPGGWLVSPLSAVTAGASPSAQGEGTSFGSPRGGDGLESPIVSVRRLSPPGAGMKVFSTDWMEVCGS